jgi:vacuolar-type H+-ATPase subunit I/STV1
MTNKIPRASTFKILSNDEWKPFQKIIDANNSVVNSKDWFISKNIGSILTIIGSAIGSIGTIVNSLWLHHNLAILVWMISNPILLVWAIGGHKKWWEGGLSYAALIIMYLVFTLSGIYAIVVGGIL